MPKHFKQLHVLGNPSELLRGSTFFLLPLIQLLTTRRRLPSRISPRIRLILRFPWARNPPPIHIISSNTGSLDPIRSSIPRSLLLNADFLS
jgi:hypothetical protein